MKQGQSSSKAGKYQSCTQQTEKKCYTLPVQAPCKDKSLTLQTLLASRVVETGCRFKKKKI